jgi:putative zinc finger protein
VSGPSDSDDRFVHDDAAYVLGALSDDEQHAFELHLLGCDRCRARVAEVEGLPALLVGVHDGDFGDEPLPDTLLPGLLRRAGRRRRRRQLVGGLAVAAAAAACLVGLVVGWPFGGGSATSDLPAARALRPVVTNPVHADARLIAKPWGTEIDLQCRYAEGTKVSLPYRLVVIDRQGRPQDLGSWQLPPDQDIDYTAGTALPADQIARIQVTLANGRPILQLTN